MHGKNEGGVATLPAIKVTPEIGVSGARICKESERAAGNLKRFRVRAEIDGGVFPTKYALARDKAEAEKLYREDVKVPADFVLYGKPTGTTPRLIVKQLED